MGADGDGVVQLAQDEAVRAVGGETHVTRAAVSVHHELVWLGQGASAWVPEVGVDFVRPEIRNEAAGAARIQQDLVRVGHVLADVAARAAADGRAVVFVLDRWAEATVWLHGQHADRAASVVRAEHELVQRLPPHVETLRDLSGEFTACGWCRGTHGEVAGAGAAARLGVDRRQRAAGEDGVGVHGAVARHVDGVGGGAVRRDLAPRAIDKPPL